MAGPYRPARQHAVRLELHAQDPVSPALSLTRFRWMALRDVNPDDLRGGSRAPMQSNEAVSERLLESDGSPGRIRTSDQPVNSRLSYEATGDHSVLSRLVDSC